MSFKDTSVGKFLAEKAPAVLDAVGDIFPPAKLLTALVSGSDMKPEDKLEFEKLAAEYEAKERADYLADRQNARSIYDKSKDISDSIARRIMNWNLPFLLALVGVNIVCIKYFDSTLLAIISNVIGQVLQMLINERLTVINFFFGSSKGSSDKTELLKKQTTPNS